MIGQVLFCTECGSATGNTCGNDRTGPVLYSVAVPQATHVEIIGQVLFCTECSTAAAIQDINNSQHSRTQWHAALQLKWPVKWSVSKPKTPTIHISMYITIETLLWQWKRAGRTSTRLLVEVHLHRQTALTLRKGLAAHSNTNILRKGWKDKNVKVDLQRQTVLTLCKRQAAYNINTMKKSWKAKHKAAGHGSLASPNSHCWAQHKCHDSCVVACMSHMRAVAASLVFVFNIQ